MTNMIFEKRNLTRAINLTHYDSFSGGAFSAYYKLNPSQGIKVLISPGHKTIKSLRRSNVWRLATKENKLLKNCKKRYQYIPHSYGVFPVKIVNHYYVGIIMQHINGKLLCKVATTTGANLKIKTNLRKALHKHGIYHEDLHGANIIFCEDTKKHYILDFDSTLVFLRDGL